MIAVHPHVQQAAHYLKADNWLIYLCTTLHSANCHLCLWLGSYSPLVICADFCCFGMQIDPHHLQLHL